MRTMWHVTVVVALVAANCAAARHLYNVLEPHKGRLACIGMDLREAPLRTSLKLLDVAFRGR